MQYCMYVWSLGSVQLRSEVEWAVILCEVVCRELGIDMIKGWGIVGSDSA